MKITQISPHAFQLTRFGFCNCYLVHESDGFTLIDTTLSGAADSILDAARRCGTANHPQICRILLTHAHTDHIGSLDALARLLGNAQIAISQRESRLLEKPPIKTTDPGEPSCKLKGGFPGATTRPTHLLTAGELYGSLRCYATPGHTPGHFSYLDERDGTLYAGDAMVTLGGAPHIPGWGPWWMPSNAVTWHRPTAKNSIEHLLETIPNETPIRRIAPGHGKVLEGGKTATSALQEAS